MKIGIVTQQLEQNYGGLLQNYALQTVLKRMGHQVFTIHVRRSDSIFIWLFGSLKILVKRFLGRNEFFPTFPKHKQKISQHTDQFINQYISVTKKYTWYNKNIQKTYNFDAFIVGSDQTWRPGYNYKIQDMFLDFLDDNKPKRIAFATSFGTNIWEYSQKQEKSCAVLAKKFDAISVREDSGVALCEKYLGVEATLVLDPTMLLTKVDYLSLIKESTNKKQNLVVYILDYNLEKKEIIDKLAEKLKLDILFIGNRDSHNPYVYYKKRIVPPVEEWLIALNNASFIFTDSFHGTVFSIIFNIPFICYANPHRGVSRFSSLLNVFRLSDRLISSKEELENTLINDRIDFEATNNKLDLERSKAITFLSNSLH